MTPDRRYALFFMVLATLILAVILMLVTYKLKSHENESPNLRTK